MASMASSSAHFIHCKTYNKAHKASPFVRINITNGSPKEEEEAPKQNTDQKGRRYSDLPFLFFNQMDFRLIPIPLCVKGKSYWGAVKLRFSELFSISGMFFIPASSPLSSLQPFTTHYYFLGFKKNKNLYCWGGQWNEAKLLGSAEESSWSSIMSGHQQLCFNFWEYQWSYPLCPTLVTSYFSLHCFFLEN